MAVVTPQCRAARTEPRQRTLRAPSGSARWQAGVPPAQHLPTPPTAPPPATPRTSQTSAMHIMHTPALLHRRAGVAMNSRTPAGRQAHLLEREGEQGVGLGAQLLHRVRRHVINLRVVGELVGRPLYGAAGLVEGGWMLGMGRLVRTTCSIDVRDVGGLIRLPSPVAVAHIEAAVFSGGVVGCPKGGWVGWDGGGRTATSSTSGLSGTHQLRPPTPPHPHPPPVVPERQAGQRLGGMGGGGSPVSTHVELGTEQWHMGAAANQRPQVASSAASPASQQRW